MKKPSSRIREEIAKLQEQLKAAETREAERIGRLALKAGLGDFAVEDGELVAAFEELAGRFRKGDRTATGKKNASVDKGISASTTTLASGEPAGTAGEA